MRHLFILGTLFFFFDEFDNRRFVVFVIFTKNTLQRPKT